MIQEKHWLTAEETLKSAESHTKLYQEIAKAQYNLDLRTFKCKRAYCPEKNCPRNSGFDTKVQREVDVAIAMRPIKSYYEYPNLDTIVLFAGDGDFLDMVEFMTKTLKKRLFVVGWSNSMSRDLAQMCTEVIYLDCIWTELSTAQKNEQMTNAEVLKMIGVGEAVILAAVRKFPDTEQRDQCIEFAFQLQT